MKNKQPSKQTYSVLHRIALVCMMWPGLVIPAFMVLDTISISMSSLNLTLDGKTQTLSSMFTISDDLTSLTLWSATIGVILYLIARYRQKHR